MSDISFTLIRSPPTSMLPSNKRNISHMKKAINRSNVTRWQTTHSLIAALRASNNSVMLWVGSFEATARWRRREETAPLLGRGIGNRNRYCALCRTTARVDGHPSRPSRSVSQRFRMDQRRRGRCAYSNATVCRQSADGCVWQTALTVRAKRYTTTRALDQQKQSNQSASMLIERPAPSGPVACCQSPAIVVALPLPPHSHPRPLCRAHVPADATTTNGWRRSILST